MSKPAQFSIGIDLGTTNCALAYIPLDPVDKRAPKSQILAVAQWDSPTTLVERDTLPSFLFRPGDDSARQFEGKLGGDWVVGLFAHLQTSQHPERVIQSAKSWLTTTGVDLSTNILPWRSEQLAEKEKLTPVRASALLLNYLRSTWNDAFPQADFDHQEITITVPASFDASAQRLTVDAARAAGYPARVRLLEEPQAAFSRWLEAHDEADAFEKILPTIADRAQHILVVDVGGGTSDFSLFEVSLAEKKAAPPTIRRVAVSDHILLGGDNIDLAMAHVVAEVQLEGSLAPQQWGHLIAQCRSIKENVLSDPNRSEPFSISIPGRGSSLFDGTLTAELSPEDVRLILFDGFYPECDKDEQAEKSAAGLREFGLPYAKDHAVTRHLAEFLRGRPPVDGLLFNGGSLKPEALQQRITDIIQDWQTQRPVVLPNAEPDLAVARGASSYGWQIQHKVSRIEAGAARGIFLEVQSNQTDSALVCLLPKGTPPEEEILIDNLDLVLQTNKPVSFQVYSSTRLDKAKPGELIGAREKEMYELNQLPPLDTEVTATGKETVPVFLSSKMNAVGLLQLECVAADNPEQRWPLEFNLTGKNHPRAAAGNTRKPSGGSKSKKKTGELGVSQREFAAACTRIESIFANLDPDKRLTANQVFQSIEKCLEQPKHEWSAVLLRKLWETHSKCFRFCYLSAGHEETWMTLAGYLLRPGYGVQYDEERIDRIWSPEETAYDYPGKRIDLARYTLWRRVSGGLSRDRQERLAIECLDRIGREKKPSAELVRLAGALERISLELKGELHQVLLHKGKITANDNGYSDPYWSSLMLLLNRAPIYTGPETVLSPEKVEETYAALRKLDWSEASLVGLVPLFLRAARIVDNASIDITKKTRKDILSKLRKAKVSPTRLTPLETYVEVESGDQLTLLGEPLPPGLVLCD